MSITRALPVIVAVLMLTANAASAAGAPATTTDAVKANCEKEFGADAAKVKECIAKGEAAKQ